MENKIIKRIKEEGIFLEEHEGKSLYSADIENEKILFPKNCPLDEEEKNFSFAHELGHFYQYKNKRKITEKFGKSCRMVDIPLSQYVLLTNLFILWEELDAWIRSYTICKEEGVSLKGFFKHASYCFKSYLTKTLKHFSLAFSLFYVPLNLILYFVYSHLSWTEFFKDASFITLIFFGMFEISALSIFLIDFYIDKKSEEIIKKKTNL